MSLVLSVPPVCLIRHQAHQTNKKNWPMSRTKMSLFYLGSNLFIIGIGLLIAPHETLKIFYPVGIMMTFFRASQAC
jgi:hypothetical protein